MNNLNENKLLMPAMVFGFCAVLCAFVIKSGFDNFSNKSDTISVTGSSDRMVTSDTAKWTMTINTRTEGAGSSGQAVKDTASSADSVTAYLKKQGVPAEAITVQSPSIVERCELTSQGYENCNLGITGYSVSQSLVVELADVNKITELSKNLSSNFERVNFINNSVEYYYNNLKNIRVEMLSEATSNARERAEAVAISGGSSIDKIVSLSSGVFQVTQKNSVDVSDYGAYDTSTIEKKVTATVKVDFSLK